MCLTYKNVSKREDWSTVLQHVTCLNSTSSTEHGLVLGIISSIQNTVILDISPTGGQLITSWWKRVYRRCRLWVITTNQVPNMWLVPISHEVAWMGLHATKPVFRVSEKRDSNQSPQLQRLPRKLKFRL